MGTAADLPLWAAFVAALAPAGALLVASIAAAIAWRSHVRQKRADRHQELWMSLTWALDQLQDPKDSYRVQLGMTVLTSLGADPLINKTDNKLLDKVNKIVAARSAPEDTPASSDKDIVVMGWKDLPPRASPGIEDLGSPL
ncbi:hypothetical protein [Kocuria arenosa]|uniref:hypothetical protein n=1 Tax=Kocuria arenosa TaxID=3071446 RepID=UPI0034D45B1E